MAKPKLQFNLKEIHQVLCPECQEKLEQLVITKWGKQVVKQALEGGKK